MQILTAGQAAEKIKDGSTIGVAGMGLAGWPEEVGRAIAANYRETGHPCGLNLKQGCSLGDWKTRGTTVLGVPGLVAKWSGAHIGSSFALNELVLAGKIECHCLPQGVIINLWREIAAGRPGLVTKVGLGTFVDPRVQGGKMNDATKTELVELIEFGGDEYLFYKSFPLDVALLRGTIADEKGNISFENEGMINEGLAVAQAAKNSGGIVIVQVEHIAEAGTLKPKDVRIPGIFVDYVVRATYDEASWQTEGSRFKPAFSGQIKEPVSNIEALALDERKLIARRCAMEIEKGSVVNLGIGIPTYVSKVLAEEGRLDEITMTAESGAVGGVLVPLPDFGVAYNPEALITHGEMFDFIDGGGLDLSCLGMGEVDVCGNVNVSKFNNRLFGPGGFIDITRSTKTILFCGTFMNKAKLDISDKGLTILEEGDITKFVSAVEQITFCGAEAGPGQRVLYITERCVFQLTDGKMVLTEIAPGVDLKNDILDKMDFMPVILAEGPGLMASAIFAGF
ncbi:MAG: acyl CoA:acetate/3-ketoacid CoA transferase [Clostridiales Family XIII bacterium]|jgi:propionate CoA-transferase|nr:acyl CoA:acetate/3-ketoacid CoA transferase [Clostridiales Family XIII bacterium]